jgi:hypothetical protein
MVYSWDKVVKQPKIQFEAGRTWSHKEKPMKVNTVVVTQGRDNTKGFNAAWLS